MQGAREPAERAMGGRTSLRFMPGAGQAGAGFEFVLRLWPSVADSATLGARLISDGPSQMVLAAVFQMDPLGVRHAAATYFTVTCDVPVKTSPFFIRCIVDPGEFLSLHDAVPFVVCKLLERRFCAFPASTANFLSPRVRLDFLLQSFLPKQLAQVLGA